MGSVSKGGTLTHPSARQIHVNKLANNRTQAHNYCNMSSAGFCRRALRVISPVIYYLERYVY